MGGERLVRRVEDESKRFHRVSGTLSRDQWTLELTQAEAGWAWTSLRTVELPGNGSVSFWSGDEEMLVLPLSGGCVVSDGHREFEVVGRTGPFSGPTDFVYIPRESEVLLRSGEGGRFAVPGAKASRRLPFRHQPVEAVALELRGAGSCTRAIVNYCMADTFEADRLLVCEVVTPSGNWSSYPPHKHDESRSGEVELEEIYYFEIADSPSGMPGFAYQRCYGTPERPLELIAEVRSGDVVLIPHGFHGPSMAPPGYDLYYLNAMAGPGDRAWMATDDPVHAWVRASWESETVDPRLAGRLASANVEQ